jgi:hypothetical protein
VLREVVRTNWSWSVSRRDECHLRSSPEDACVSTNYIRKLNAMNYICTHANKDFATALGIRTRCSKAEKERALEALRGSRNVTSPPTSCGDGTTTDTAETGGRRR